MRMIVMTAVLATVALPVSAQPLQAQLSRCVAIPGVLQRLACYDSVARGAGVVAPPVAAAPAYRAPPPPAPVASYVPPAAGLGSERVQQAPQVAAARPPQALTAKVTKVTFDPHGRFTMTLEDGQVWRQVAGDETILRDPRVQSVRISRGALGSYDLTVIGRNASYKVTRLQ